MEADRDRDTQRQIETDTDRDTQRQIETDRDRDTQRQRRTSNVPSHTSISVSSVSSPPSRSESVSDSSYTRIE
eukprot:COSAG03_NODE_9633_length_704_cov_1.148760_1_plen_73_part_00